MVTSITFKDPNALGADKPKLPEDDEEESEEESEESEEEQPAQAEPEEEVKKGKCYRKMSRLFSLTHFNVVSCVYHLEPVKILSKKEQKKLEDEEFERLMAEVGTQPAAAQAPAEESK